MGTLVCPLCCDEEFSNQLSLRYHLLSITDNVYCPECCQRFDSILQLADHLDGMCGKAELMNNIEEYSRNSDVVTAEGMAEEDNFIMHEGDTTETEAIKQEVMQEVISVAANPQLDDLESLCLVTDGDNQETAVNVIKNEYMDITKEESDAVGHGILRDVMEQSYVSGNYEVMVEKSAGSEEALPGKLSTPEMNGLMGVDDQMCGVVVDSSSSAGEAVCAISESQTVLPEMECPGDREMGVSEYSCSSCGITFGSVMEHIRMYHGGQEVVIEVPQAKKTAFDKLIGISKEVLRTSDEQMTDMEVSPVYVDTSEQAELQETIGATNFVSTFSEIQQQTSEIHPGNQINAFNHAVINSDSHENVKRHIWFKEKTRVIADEEEIKQIVSGPKRVIPPVHTRKQHFRNELQYVSKEVKIGRFWETRAANVSKSDSPSRSNKTEVSMSSLPGEMKKVNNKRLLFKKDTRTSIEKLFSGSFLLKGTGGRGTRPGPYLGVNRVPEVKVIMSPGDKGTENAISVFTCSTCQKEFGNVSAFERHSCTVAKACMLVCKLCDEDVSDMKAMRVHMESVHNIKTEIPSMAKRKYNMQMLPNPVKCESCDVTFTTIRSLKLHSKIHEQPKMKVPLVCPVCHNMCSSDRTLRQHMKVHTELLPMKKSEGGMGEKDEDVTDKEEKNRELSLLVCKVCYKSFGNNEDLRVHWQEHLLQEKTEEEEEGKKEMEQAPDVTVEATVPEEKDAQHKKSTSPCVRCHKEIDKSCKEEHMAKHLSLLRYSCPICNKSFSKHGHLNMHMRIHRGTKEYSCIQCGKIFANTNLLRTHIQSHMVQRPYMCGFCGRGFFRPRDKVEHERIHTGEKPYSCSVCGMRFRVRYCLSLHMRRHTGVRPYSCKVCGKTFRTGTAFKAHTKIHLDERSYRCPFCPKKFKTLIQLLGHKNSHTKPYPCLECNRPFSSLYAVRKHMASHEEGISGKVPLKFQCDVCGASYARSFALKDHLKIHDHNIPPAAAGKTCADDSSSDLS